MQGAVAAEISTEWVGPDGLAGKLVPVGVPASGNARREAGTSHSAGGHVPVLLREAVELLSPRDDGRYVDGTFGGGGHTRAILAASAPGGQVLAIDADPEAVARGERLAGEPGLGNRFRIVQANFAEMGDVVRRMAFGPLDGVLLDLGLSSFQLDDPGRGFSFRGGGPLDMRIDPEEGEPVAQMVNELPAVDLARIIFEFGEEPRGRRIAGAIVREREREPFATTDRLAAVVAAALGGRRGSDTHPATRTFQALRIAQNRELESLSSGLRAAVGALAPGGRLVTIAFHSLEDRIVKQFIAAESAACVCPPELPVCVCDQTPRLRKVTGRAVKPSAEEIAANPRSRSAVLRAAERLPLTTERARPRSPHPGDVAATKRAPR